LYTILYNSLRCRLVVFRRFHIPKLSIRVEFIKICTYHIIAFAVLNRDYNRISWHQRT